MSRDYTTISPSARSLLVMRARTELPFARRAAERLLGEAAVSEEIARLSAMQGNELRLRHFEARYRSIDTLLADGGFTRVLELGGGLSFRGLALAQRAAVTYFDTDLPAMTLTKARLVGDLAEGPLVGDLRVRALDALDPDAFRDTVAELPDGPLAIVNEGLLVYLDPDEKRRLAANIRATLWARGGVWITADIYVRGPRDPRIERDERLAGFLAAHRVEDNKFESFEAAAAWVGDVGLAVGRRVVPAGDSTRQTWELVPAE
jgi:O-methyltransferase involved in polyketide biosynthesis